MKRESLLCPDSGRVQADHGVMAPWASPGEPNRQVKSLNGGAAEPAGTEDDEKTSHSVYVVQSGSGLGRVALKGVVQDLVEGEVGSAV